MWCNILVWWCKMITFAPHLKHAIITKVSQVMAHLHNLT